MTLRTDLSSKIKLDLSSKQPYQPTDEVALAALTRYEKLPTTIYASATTAAEKAAEQVASVINATVAERGRCVLGLGSGSNALDVYDHLVRLYFADRLSFRNVVVFNIGEIGHVATEKANQSTIGRLRDRLLSKVDIEQENIHTLNIEGDFAHLHYDCRRYESLIADNGGLDLVVCELSSNSSVAFNEPGSMGNSQCRVMMLGSKSRAHVAEAYQLDEAPVTAVTLGIANFLNARQVITVAWGENKAQAVYNAVEGAITERYPASYLQMHPQAHLHCDLDAADSLTRIQFPWRVTSCDWDRYLTRRAIVWLSLHLQKPLLKLTNKDYNDNGLSELLSVYGSAYNCNIEVFNDMQHTITGWPGGKPNTDDTNRPERATPYPKRVLCVGPHPDDVAVAMGGTVRRLVDQGHDVHVLFQTPGDLSVTDEDLMRYLLFLEHANERFGVCNEEQLNEQLREIANFLETRTTKDFDTELVRYLKGRIFIGEGTVGCRYMGVKKSNIHYIPHPFYTEDVNGHGRIGEADVLPMVDLIRELQPHQIYFANDLTDPYGTHLRASNALLAAVDLLRDEPFMADCRLWMYRGQWGTWRLDNVEMAVPMSPDEFGYKRETILKHQSQVHDSPYRDEADTRLLWQNSLESNKNMALQYAALGLAVYEAIEAFVRFRLPEPENS